MSGIEWIKFFLIIVVSINHVKLSNCFSILIKIGLSHVHMNIPLHKAILLVGPRGSGKELLVHIACNELGGLLLDLSLPNIAQSFNTGIVFMFA